MAKKKKLESLFTLRAKDIYKFFKKNYPIDHFLKLLDHIQYGKFPYTNYLWGLSNKRVIKRVPLILTHVGIGGDGGIDIFSGLESKRIRIIYNTFFKTISVSIDKLADGKRGFCDDNTTLLMIDTYKGDG